jgi:hypothetical protein
VKVMGLETILAQALHASPLAARLYAQAQTAGVRAMVGGFHAQAARERGTGIVRVTIPANSSSLVMLEQFLFELTNAVQQPRHEALIDAAKRGEVADGDDYARAKINIEQRGSFRIAKIGMELRRAGMTITADTFYLPTMATYLKAKKANGSLTEDEFFASQADEVLDRPHGQGSHRIVYRAQFAGFAAPANKDVRRASALAGQVLTMSKLIPLRDAIGKLFATTTEGASVLDWLGTQQESPRWNPLYQAFLHFVADSLNASGNIEAAVTALGRSRAAAVYAWVERHDEGQYSNLSQILGLYLGYYDRHPL